MAYLYKSPKHDFMKKRLLCTCISVFLLVSCHRDSPEVKESAQEQQIAHALNGIFAATIPCGDCPGIDIEISFFKDHTFCRTTYNRGSDIDKTKMDIGSWEVDADSLITIHIEKNEATQYFKLNSAQELAMLTKEKEAVAGELADKYVLRKR